MTRPVNTAAPRVVRAGSPILYEQVKDALLERIASGEFGPGDMLPTEEELCRQYGVSRITVRRAVNDIAAQFLVVRKRGIGTIVTRRLADRRVFTFTGHFNDRSLYKTRTLLAATEPAPAEVARALEIARADPVRHVRRVTLQRGDPMALVDAWMPVAVGEAPSPTAEEVESPLRKDVRFAGRPAERAEQVLEATAADALVARSLGVARGRPIMRAQRVYFTGTGTPVRYVRMFYHPDRYRFTFDLLPSSDPVAIDLS